jgi:Spy/CpxP family protein refolding chaperone
MDPGVQRQLALLPSQVAALEGEHQRTLAYRRTLRGEFDKAEAALADALRRFDVSDEACKGLLTRVEELRRRRNVERTRMLLAMYWLLTPEQRSRVRFLDLARASRDRP